MFQLLFMHVLAPICPALMHAWCYVPASADGLPATNFDASATTCCAVTAGVTQRRLAHRVTSKACVPNRHNHYLKRFVSAYISSETSMCNQINNSYLLAKPRMNVVVCSNPLLPAAAQ
jgi:hypothetical protein